MNTALFDRTRFPAAGLALLTSLAALSGCHDGHRDDRNVVVYDQTQRFQHRGYFDDRHDWHGGYYDEGHAFHADPHDFHAESHDQHDNHDDHHDSHDSHDDGRGRDRS